jgi:hypothetical protein
MILQLECILGNLSAHGRDANYQSMQMKRNANPQQSAADKGDERG